MKDKTSITLGEALCIPQAESMRKRFLRALEVSNTIEIKAEKTKKVDTSGLQIIAAVKKELDASSGEIIWNKPSKELIESARILGVLDTIGLND